MTILRPRNIASKAKIMPATQNVVRQNPATMPIELALSRIRIKEDTASSTSKFIRESLSIIRNKEYSGYAPEPYGYEPYVLLLH